MDTNQLYFEKELFSLIAEGDEAAFGRLFELYVPKLQQIIYPMVQSEAAVKDIAQEVFLSLWLGRDKLPGVEVPRNWIFRITYNQSFRYLKKRTLLEKLHADASADLPEPASSETEQAVDVSEVNRLIRDAIGQLPAQGRRIFEMNRLGGMRPAAIAGELGISVQAVRNSLTRSGRSIRTYLEDQGIRIPLILILFLGN